MICIVHSLHTVHSTGLRGGLAGQLPWTPTYKGHKDLNKWKYGASKLRFPHAKQML